MKEPSPAGGEGYEEVEGERGSPLFGHHPPVISVLHCGGAMHLKVRFRHDAELNSPTLDLLPIGRFEVWKDARRGEVNAWQSVHCCYLRGSVCRSRRDHVFEEGREGRWGW